MIECGDVGVSRATARCPLIPRVGSCQIGISSGCGCWFQLWMKISVSMDISVFGFYGYIGYIGDISMNILT